MPGERFITSDDEDGQALESALDTDQVCHVDGLMNIQLLFKLRTRLCGSCTCDRDVVGSCILRLCDTEQKSCDNTHNVSESCCALLCDSTSSRGAEMVWLTVALVGVLCFVALAVFVGIYYARRKQQQQHIQDLESANSVTHSSESLTDDSRETSDSLAEPTRGLMEGTTSTQVVRKHDAASSSDISLEPSAPLLEHLGMEGRQVQCPVLVSSTETLGSDYLERNSPPPSYEDVIADEEASAQRT